MNVTFSQLLCLFNVPPSKRAITVQDFCSKSPSDGFAAKVRATFVTLSYKRNKIHPLNFKSQTKRKKKFFKLHCYYPKPQAYSPFKECNFQKPWGIDKKWEYKSRMASCSYLHTKFPSGNHNKSLNGRPLSVNNGKYQQQICQSLPRTCLQHKPQPMNSIRHYSKFIK